VLARPARPGIQSGDQIHDLAVQRLLFRRLGNDSAAFAFAQDELLESLDAPVLAMSRTMLK
jgi:hypothetical protein